MEQFGMDFALEAIPAVMEVLARTGDEALQVKHVGVHQHVHHLLLFIRLVAHVRHDDEPCLFKRISCLHRQQKAEDANQ